MFNKVVHYLGTGLAVGSVTTCVCLAAMNGMDGTLLQVMAWLCASALYGLVSIIFEAESLPLPLAIGIHLLLCLGITLGTGYLLGYSAQFGSLFLAIIPVFLVLYGLISAGIWLYSRHCARDTNDRLAGK